MPFDLRPYAIYVNKMMQASLFMHKCHFPSLYFAYTLGLHYL